MYRHYVLAMITGWFVLWGWASDWNLDNMVFWEGHGSNSCILGGAICGYHARLGVAALLIVVAVITLISKEERGR